MFCNNNGNKHCFVCVCARVTRIFRNYRMSLRLLHFVSYNQLHTSHFFLLFFFHFTFFLRFFPLVDTLCSYFAIVSLVHRMREREKEKKNNEHFIFNFSSFALDFSCVRLRAPHSHQTLCDFDTLHHDVYLSHIKNTNPKMRFNFLFGGRAYARCMQTLNETECINRMRSLLLLLLL